MALRSLTIDRCRSHPRWVATAAKIWIFQYIKYF